MKKKKIYREYEQLIPDIMDIAIMLHSSSKDIYVNNEQRIGFQKGAKWMRDLLIKERSKRLIKKNNGTKTE